MSDAQASPTERVLAEMWLEDTGTHFLDSGMAHGRAWQQSRLAAGIPEGAAITEDIAGAWALARRGGADILVDDIGNHLVVDTWKYLVSTLEHMPHADAVWRRWSLLQDAGRDRSDRDSWPTQMEMFVALVGGRADVTGGPYGEGRPAIVYTYNEETWFDRDIQHLQFRVEGRRDEDPWLEPGEYALVQLHNGADARGGLTEPRLFRTLGELGLFEHGTAGLSCEGTMPASPGQITIDGSEVVTIHHRWAPDRDHADSDTPVGVVVGHDDTTTEAVDTRWERHEILRRDEDGVIRCPHDGTAVTPWYIAE